MAVRFLDQESPGVHKSRVRFLDGEPEAQPQIKPQLGQRPAIPGFLKAADKVMGPVLGMLPSIGTAYQATKLAQQVKPTTKEDIPAIAATAATMGIAPYAGLGFQGAMKLAGAAGIAGGFGKATEQAISGEKSDVGSQVGEAVNQAKYQLAGSAAVPVIQGAVKSIAKGYELFGKGGQAAYRAAVSRFKGPNRGVIDEVLDNVTEATPTVPKATEKFFAGIKEKQQKAQEAINTAKNLPVIGATTEDVSGKAVKLAQELRTKSYEASEKAAEALKADPLIDRDELVNPIDALTEQFKVKGKAFGESASKAVAALGRWKSGILEITKGAKASGLLGPTGKPLPGGPPTNVSEKDLKRIMKSIDDDAVWDGPADEPIKKALRGLRGIYKGVLERNTAYKEAIAPSSDLRTKAEKIEELFGLEFQRGNVVAKTTSTPGKARSLLSGKNEVASDIAKKTGMGDIVDSAISRIKSGELKDAVVKQATKAANVRYPDEIKIMRMAETAIRQGRGSPAYKDLDRTLSAVIGPEDGSQLASDIVTSAAKDIFQRSKGNVFSGGSIGSMVGGAKLGESSISQLKKIDDFFSTLAISAKEAGKRGVPIDGATTGTLLRTLVPKDQSSSVKPIKNAQLSGAILNFKNSDDAREASKSLPIGTKIRLNGEIMEIVEPGRLRGKGAPKAIRYVGQADV